MNGLLRRQIEVYFGSADAIPEELKHFIDALDQELEAQESERENAVQKRGRYVDAANQIARSIIATNDPEGLFVTAADQLKEKFDLFYVQYLHFNPATGELSLLYGTGDVGKTLKNQGFSISLQSNPIGKAAADKKPQVIHYRPEESSINPVSYLQKASSQLIVPIIYGAELLGAFDFYTPENAPLDTQLQMILEVLTGQIGIIAENIRLRNEMAERLNELNLLQDMTTAAGWESFREMIVSSSEGFLYDDQSGAGPAPNPTPAAAMSEAVEASLVKTMQIRGEVIGSIGIENDPERPLSEEESQLLESITEEVAEALERARLFETSQRSAAELSILNEMGNAFSAAFDERSIAENVYTYASRLMDIHNFYIAFYDEESEEITFPIAVVEGQRITPDHPDAAQWAPRKLGEGLTGHIILNRKPILIESNAEKVLEELGLPYNRYGKETKSWLGVPMLMGDRTLGVISVQSDQVSGLYNNHHQELLSAIASQASVAINNARLFDQEQDRAKQERLVRTITDKVRRGSDSQTIMRIALEELSQVLDADLATIHLGTRDQLLLNSANQPPQLDQTNGSEEEPQ